LIRVIGERSSPLILWMDDIEALKFTVEVLRRLEIPFNIPRKAPSSCGNIVTCRHNMFPGFPSAESCQSFGGVVVDCSILRRSRLAFALELLRKIVGGVREAVLGVDLGLRRSAMALVTAGSLVYSRVAGSTDVILREICLAEPSELIVGVGYTPAVSGEASRFLDGVRRCGHRAYSVDEFESNSFRAYGLKGVDEYVEKDVIAAIQIALRVYESIASHGG